MIRGLLAENFVNSSFWFNVPTYLSDPTLSIKNSDDFNTNNDIVDGEVEDNIACLYVQSLPPMFNLEKYNDLNKLRVVLYIIRFLVTVEIRKGDLA